jgi:hypothetical protein
MTTKALNYLAFLSLIYLTLATSARADSSPATSNSRTNCQLYAQQLLLGAAEVHGISEFWSHLSCFAEATQADASYTLLPMRTGLWKAVNNYGGSQQTGASASSGASTNAVSKPSGPTALAEEFGGANVTTGTSSTTLQWSPGTLLQNLVLTGVASVCPLPSTSLPSTPGCISEKTIENLSGLTLKITGNTSGNSSSPTGTAASASTGATSTAQQVKISSQGTSGASFSGLTVQYSFGGKSKARTAVAAAKDKQNYDKAKAANLPTDSTKVTTAANSQAVQYHSTELAALVQAAETAGTCKATVSWATGLAAPGSLFEKITSLRNDLSRPATSETNIDQIAESLRASYLGLYNQINVESSECKNLRTELSSLYASMLEAIAYDDLSTAQKGDLGVEYDLNTPQNKPSYSTVKLNYSHSWGKATGASPKTSQAVDSNSTGAGKLSDGKKQENQPAPMSSAQAKFHAKGMAAAPKVVGDGTSTTNSFASQALKQATTTPSPWTFNASGVVDIYNSEPPSGVPNASHLRDIQAGAEISYIFAPTRRVTSINGSQTVTPPGSFRQFIGNVTAAAAYSYQDQTSPAILTGPALSGFTGLPSSTTAAYAQRGVIHLGQVRLGFGSGTNVSFPLAFTYSNRTELIVHPTWMAQFGVSYNLNSLFGSSSNGSTNTPSQ